MKVLMLVISDVDADARVRREADALVTAGHDVVIVALRGTSAAFEVIGVGGGVRAVPRPSTPLLAQGRAAARWLLLPTAMARLRQRFTAAARDVASGLTGIDAVHAHDLETLALGAELADRWDVPLVYDSHELWTDRVRHGRPTPLLRRTERSRERQLGARAAAVITVGEEIADWMREVHGWDHVHVVRNSFPQLDLPPLTGPPTGLLYAGRIAARRELDVIAAAAPDLPLPVVVMGPGDDGLRARLRLVPNLRVRQAVPVEEVVEVLRELGVALITAGDGPLSYRWSLPNKLFQAVQAGVPVVATDLPAQSRVIAEHGIGTVYPPGEPDALRGAVERLVADHVRFRAGVVAAGETLSWAVDAEVLLRVYRGL